MLTYLYTYTIDNGFHTGMILVDLQKAFETLDHTILLQK